MPQATSSAPKDGKWKEAWQDESGKRWARNQAKTDAQLGPLGEVALSALQLKSGEAVLDVGCGGGQTLLSIREQVGEAGRVIGLDISSPLLECARPLVASYANVELLLGDASKVRPERPVDALFSRFGVMFFEDSLLAFQNLREMLRQGGRFSFLCWQGMEKNAWATVPLDAVRSTLTDAPALEMLEPGGPGPFRFADAEALAGLLSRAGFEKVEVAAHRPELLLGGARTLEEAVDFALEIGPAARLLAGADSETKSRARQALTQAFAPYLKADGVQFSAATYVATGQRR